MGTVANQMKRMLHSILLTGAALFPSAALALTCAPVSVEQMAKDPQAVLVVVAVSTIQQDEKPASHLAPDTHYGVQVRRSFKGPHKEGDSLTLTGRAIASWGAAPLEQNGQYFVALELPATPAAPSGQYHFSACSPVWKWDPRIDDILTLDRLLRLPAAPGDAAAGSKE